jgi:hypothetical protein
MNWEVANHFTNRKLDYPKDIEENIDSVKTLMSLNSESNRRKEPT